MLNADQRQLFDDLLSQTIEALPADLQELLEQVPLILDDEPPLDMMRKLGLDPRTSELFGLHWGVPLTRRSVEHSGRMPDQMRMFRGPIMRISRRSTAKLRRQIQVTLLHEIGHHFGLSEQDLTALGYG